MNTIYEKLDWTRWSSNLRRAAQFGIGIGVLAPLGWMLVQMARGKWHDSFFAHLEKMFYLGAVSMVVFGAFGYILAMHERQVQEQAGHVLFDNKDRLPSYTHLRTLQFSVVFGLAVPLLWLLTGGLTPEERIVGELYGNARTYLILVGLGSGCFGLFGYLFGIHEQRLFTAATSPEQTDQNYRVGLENSRYFWVQAEKEIARATRYDYPLSLVIFDIDNFKSINKLHGHRIANKVLTRVGEVLNDQIRRYDVVTQLGGAEFGILMPDAGPDGARGVAERLAGFVVPSEQGSTSLAPNGAQFQIEASFGVASMKPTTEDNVDHLISAADRALHRAKDSDRKRIAVGKEHRADTSRQRVDA